MKKRFRVLFLVITMFLMLFSTNVFASNRMESDVSQIGWYEEDLENNLPALKFRHADFEDGVAVENTEYCLETPLFMTPTTGTHIRFFYYTENGEETLLRASDLRVSDESVIRIFPDEMNPDAVAMEVPDFGSATIYYGDVSLDVEIGFPNVGFFSVPIQSTESYLYDRFMVTEETNVFYAVPNSDSRLLSVELPGDLDEIADIELDESGAYATITVNGTPEDRFYDIVFSVRNMENGEEFEDVYSIEIINGKPALRFRHADFEDGIAVENTEHRLETLLFMTPTTSTHIRFFYYTENGEETLLRASDLRVSDESVIQIFPDEMNPDAVAMEVPDFGSATIYYGDVSLDVEIGFPNAGFFSDKELSTENYLYDRFMVTEENNVFYLVPNTDLKLLSVELPEDLDEIADIELDESGAYATITVNGTPEDRWYDVLFTIRNVENGEEFEDGYSIEIFNGKSALKYRMADWIEVENGIWYPTENKDTIMETYFRAEPRSEGMLFFYYTENGEEILLTASDLTVSDTSIVQIFENGVNPQAVQIEPQNFGITTISYERNGVTYELEVEIGLPNVGFYSDITASIENYLFNNFVVTEENNEFYIVANKGWELLSVNLPEDLEQIADVGVVENTNYAVITVNGIPEDRWYDISFTVRNCGDVDKWEECKGIELINGKTVPSRNPFIDVTEELYYYHPVLWAYENNITAGLSATEFAPEAACTRGQVVTFLWRAMGQPEPTTTANPFVDVNSNEYYYKAVLWALENGITAGVDSTHFEPNTTVTRGQFVTFLHRAEGNPSYNVENPFIDVPNTYYYDAVLWAYENGVTAGTDSTHFAPEDFCTRGQVVTFLYRALNNK